MVEPENVIFVIINKSTKEKVKVLQHIIYMDESGKEGKFYGNFYGGALIRSTDLLQTIEKLSFLKQSLNLYGEVKWQKVTSQYLDKYMQLTGLFFDFIERDVIKIRIMFTHNYVHQLIYAIILSIFQTCFWIAIFQSGSKN